MMILDNNISLSLALVLTPKLFVQTKRNCRERKVNWILQLGWILFAFFVCHCDRTQVGHVGTETCFAGITGSYGGSGVMPGLWKYIRAGSTERGKDSPLIAESQGLLSDLAPFKCKQPLIQLFLPPLHEGKWSSRFQCSPSPSLCVPPVLWSISSGGLFPAVLVGGGVWSLYGFARRTLLCYKLMQWRFLVHGHWGKEKNKDTLMLFKATTEELK